MNAYFEVCYRPKNDLYGWVKTAIVSAPKSDVVADVLEHELGYPVIISCIIFAGPIYLLKD